MTKSVVLAEKGDYDPVEHKSSDAKTQGKFCFISNEQFFGSVSYLECMIKTDPLGKDRQFRPVATTRDGVWHIKLYPLLLHRLHHR